MNKINWGRIWHPIHAAITLYLVWELFQSYKVINDLGASLIYLSNVLAYVVGR